MTPFIRKIAMPALGLTMAASLALSPIAATPARADDGSGALVAGSFLALLMAGIIASDAHSEPGPPVYQPHPPGYPPRPPVYHPPVYHPPHPVPPPAPPQYLRALPSQCRVTYRLSGAVAPYYKKACLQRQMPGWRRLPVSCEQLVRVRGSGTGLHRVFSESCLVRHGYHPAWRRW